MGMRADAGRDAICSLQLMLSACYGNKKACDSIAEIYRWLRSYDVAETLK